MYRLKKEKLIDAYAIVESSTSKLSVLAPYIVLGHSSRQSYNQNIKPFTEDWDAISIYKILEDWGVISISFI